MNLWGVFATGLFTGGLTCLAVQGGLLASTIAQREQGRLTDEVARGGRAFPIVAFLAAKLIAYTILGFLLGWLGSLFTLSLQAQVIMQSLVALFMIATAFNLLNVHPIFRYVVIQPPKFVYRLVRNQSKSKDVFAPALLGAFTVFIPCGTTQAMMALAIASGSPALGAAILFAFTLGTSPIFFILGYFATRLGDAFQQRFMKVAAYAIILLAVFNLNNTIALTGSTSTLDTLWRNVYCTLSICDSSPLLASARGTVLGQAVNVATINIEATSYSPNNLVVKRASTVTLNLVNTTGGGCTQAFIIPRLGIKRFIPLGSSDRVQFTAPNEPGQLAFMCGMGMYRGIINVI